MSGTDNVALFDTPVPSVPSLDKVTSDKKSKKSLFPPDGSSTPDLGVGSETPISTGPSERSASEGEYKVSDDEDEGGAWDATRLDILVPAGSLDREAKALLRTLAARIKPVATGGQQHRLKRSGKKTGRKSLLKET